MGFDVFDPGEDASLELPNVVAAGVEEGGECFGGAGAGFAEEDGGLVGGDGGGVGDDVVFGDEGGAVDGDEFVFGWFADVDEGEFDGAVGAVV